MSTKTLRKRIALVAVSALGFGLVSTVPALAADSAGTAAIGPVRVSMTGAAQDSVAGAAVVITADSAWASADFTTDQSSITVTLTTAPSAAATLTIAHAEYTDQGATGTPDTTVQLGDSGLLLTSGTDTATFAGTTAGLSFAANVTGRYVGTISIDGKSGASDLLAVPFDFTTTGAPTTLEVSASATTVNPSGTSTITATLKDAAGNTTQGSTVDSIAFSAAAGTLGTASLDAAALSDGTGTSVLTAASTSGTAHVVTITPQGTLSGLGVKTLTVTTDATTIYATTDGNIAFTVSAPADAATATGTVDGGNRAQSVRTGSSAITVAVTNAEASKNLRFKVTASAGTVDGVAFTTPQYKVVATSSTGTGSLSFTLGGGALLNSATVTVEQVSVVNASIAPTTTSTTDIVITQADSAVSASTLSMGIAGSVVRALGTVTSVDVTVKDQFAGALGAGWTVRAYRTSVSAANLLSTATTNASGVATVSVSPLSTVVSGGSETYVYTADYPGVTQITTASESAKNLTVTYTTTGGITSLSVAIAGSNGDLATALGAADTTITDTEATVTAAFPVVYVPSSGTVTEGSAQTAKATLAGVVTAGSGAVSNTFRLAADATADNTSTYTTTEGAFVAAAAGGAWNAGLSTLTVAEGTTVYVFATTTGLHTVTVTSGGKTVAIKFWAKNQATDYYTVSAVADSSSLLPSANSVVTVTVKDIFGNVVDAADGLLTATAADKVRLAGQALSQSLNTTASGTSAFTIIADAAAGTGTITIAPTATGAESWLSTYVAPTGAAAPVSSATVTITVAGVAGKSAAELAADAATAAVTALEAKLAAEKVAAEAAAATAATAAAVKAAADKAESDAAIAALKAQLDAAAVKAAADAAANAAAVAAAQAAAVEAAQAATDAATEALDAANAATDAANASAEAGDAATAAAQDAADAVAALSTQVSEMISALKKQITALTNLVIKIQKKVKA